jgi:hypothetical protein
MESANFTKCLRRPFVRVYAEIDDLTNKELDQAAISKGSKKKVVVAEAIDLYLHHDKSELDLVIKERDHLRSKQDLRCKEISQIKNELSQTEQELEASRARENQLKSELNLVRSDREQALVVTESIMHELERYKENQEKTGRYKIYYITKGPLRGSCKHQHRRLYDAYHCLKHDFHVAEMAGSYSDRHVCAVENGHERELYEHEINILDHLRGLMIKDTK